MRRVLAVAIATIALASAVGGLFFNQTLFLIALIASMFLMHAFGHGGHGHSTSDDDSDDGKRDKSKEGHSDHEGHWHNFLQARMDRRLYA